MSDNKESNMKDSNSDEVIGKGVVETKNTTTPSSSKEKSLSTVELSALDYSDFSTPARMLALGQQLCQSQLVPLKKPQDVLTALMTGKELGLPFITSVSQIYPINGRPTLGVHIQRAICLKNGIIIEKVEDYTPVYSFAKADENGKVVVTQDLKTGKNVPVIVGTGTIDQQPKNTLKQEIDRRTTYKLTREIKMPSSKFKEVTATGSFSYTEAVAAELLDKDAWAKYLRRMLDARAFTNAVKEIASDLTLGLSAPNELSNNFYINDANEEVHYAEVEEQ